MENHRVPRKPVFPRKLWKIKDFLENHGKSRSSSEVQKECNKKRLKKPKKLRKDWKLWKEKLKKIPESNSKRIGKETFAIKSYFKRPANFVNISNKFPFIITNPEKQQVNLMLTFLQCSNKSILSRRHDVAGVLMLKSVTQRPSSDKCCGWNCWPASHNVAICGSHLGVAPWNNDENEKIKDNQSWKREVFNQ